MTSVYSSLSPQTVLERIAQATGNVKFRASSELSVTVKGSRFRVSLPPDGFSHPYRLVIRGDVYEAGNGSRIDLREVRPWLPNLLVPIVLF